MTDKEILEKALSYIETLEKGLSYIEARLNKPFDDNSNVVWEAATKEALKNVLASMGYEAIKKPFFVQKIT